MRCARADLLQVTTWLSPLSADGAAQNVPAFLSVEAILLQKAKAASFQVRSAAVGRRAFALVRLKQYTLLHAIRLAGLHQRHKQTTPAPAEEDTCYCLKATAFLPCAADAVPVSAHAWPHALHATHCGSD